MSKTKIQKCARLDVIKPEYLVLCTRLIPRAMHETEWPKGFERGVPKLNRLWLSAKRPAVLLKETFSRRQKKKPRPLVEIFYGII
jgi:hypothetical protein